MDPSWIPLAVHWGGEPRIRIRAQKVPGPRRQKTATQQNKTTPAVFFLRVCPASSKGMGALAQAVPGKRNHASNAGWRATARGPSRMLLPRACHKRTARSGRRPRTLLLLALVLQLFRQAAAEAAEAAAAAPGRLYPPQPQPRRRGSSPASVVAHIERQSAPAPHDGEDDKGSLPEHSEAKPNHKQANQTNQHFLNHCLPLRPWRNHRRFAKGKHKLGPIWLQ